MNRWPLSGCAARSSSAGKHRHHAETMALRTGGPPGEARRRWTGHHPPTLWSTERPDELVVDGRATHRAHELPTGHALWVRCALSVRNGLSVESALSVRSGLSVGNGLSVRRGLSVESRRSEEHTSELQSRG